MLTRSRPDRDDRGFSSSFIATRASRKEFWLMISLGLAVYLALACFGFRFGVGGYAGLILVWHIKRAHDFGRSGWWAALALAAPFALLALPAWAPLTWILCGLALLLVTIVFGCVPGDMDANRFGPPPPAWRRAGTQGLRP
jgi:uncharacterized membrane protein YhaH (DUF805 family)